MPTYTSEDGALSVTAPAGYTVGAQSPTTEPTRAPGRRSGRGGALPTGATPVARPGTAGLSTLLDALTGQGFTLVDAPVAIAGDPRRTRRSGSARIAVTVDAEEDAVVLLEQDGLYSWRGPDGRSIVAPTSPTRGVREAPRATRTVIFDVAMVSGERAQRQTRGWLSDAVFHGVRAIVLRYAARKITKSVVRHLESHVVPKLLRISDPDPRRWSPDGVAGLGQHLPEERPARVLLFVHGTFSSTVGGFGSLAAHTDGKRLLTDAVAGYDAVLGYDHLTLSVDPSANAAELLGLLRAIDWPQPPIIDIVTHSRGGLVTRSFAEEALPASGWAARTDRIVFAACTNAGTQLANPDNWSKFVDIYTNLAAAAARLVPEQLVATILREAMKSVGALVKYVISYATDGDGVPGVAAMEPGGPFVTALNRTQPGQPVPSTSPWYVIASNFEPKLVGDGAPSLPARLRNLLADLLVDQLLGTANDLVVDTASMGAIDSPIGVPSGFVHGRLDYAGHDAVFHTIYFTQPRTAQAIAAWLQLGATPAPTRPARRRPQRTRREAAAVDESLAVDESPAVDDAADSASDGGGYDDTGYDDTGDGGDERDGFDRVTVGHGLAPRRGVTGRFPRSGAVLLPDLGAVLPPVPVVPPPTSPAPPPTRRAPAKKGSSARKTAAKKAAKRAAAKTSTGRKATGRAGAGSARNAGPATVHVRASMAAQARVDEVTTLHCTIGREELAAAASGVQAAGRAPADPARPITVQVVAKAHADVSGDDRAELALPEPDAPIDLYFDIVPLAVGTGEVHVLLRQGPIPLVTLALRPQFVAAEAPVAVTRAIGAVAAAVPGHVPSTCVKQWLRITERQSGADTFYQFELEAEDLKELITARSRPLAGDRAGYVDALYRRIEARWISSGEDVAAFGTELRALGGELFDELIPPELGRTLWKHRKRLKNVLVMSDEPFIPWELVHLKSDSGSMPAESWFLSRLGSMRWIQGTYPPDTLSFAKARYVVPDYPPGSDLELAATADEADYVRTELGGKAIPANSDAVLKALSRPGAFDLLHFAGHGESVDNSSRILLTGRVEDDASGAARYVVDQLTDTTVRQLANLQSRTGSRPFVMINACQAGRQTTMLTSVGGFAQAFVDRGAGAFVSSLWSVGDEPAGVFARSLYGALQAGGTLAEATVAARRATEKVGGEATWLAYVVYGNPCARLTNG